MGRDVNGQENATGCKTNANGSGKRGDRPSDPRLYAPLGDVFKGEGF